MITGNPEWREFDEGEHQETQRIEPVRVLQEDLVVEIGDHCIGGEPHEDPNDLANPIIALLIVLGAVDKENADDR